MSDVMTKLQRSRCMARIKGKNTRPELALRKALWTKGFRYRIHTKLPGKPDIVFPKAKVAVFVDGCFWHGCPRHGMKPKTNRKFWANKIQANIARDKKVVKQLKLTGWTVFRIWEHKIKQHLEGVVKQISKILESHR